MNIHGRITHSDWKLWVSHGDDHLSTDTNGSQNGTPQYIHPLTYAGA